MEEKASATLTWDGRTVDMKDAQAAAALIEEMVRKEFKMPGIRIELKRIEEINIKPKNGKIIISMETYLPPGDIGRLFNMAAQGLPVSAVIESPQAEFDLRIEEINIKTGEIRPPPAAGHRGAD